MRPRLLLFPCNGNAIEAIGCVGDSFDLVGFIDDSPAKIGQNAHGLTVFDRTALSRFADAHVLAVPGSPTSYGERPSIISSLGLPNERFATVIHSRATISPLARIGYNVLLMAGVVVTSNAVIGNHVCVLPNTVIHHDARIENYALVGSNVTLAGGVVVGENAYVGSGTSVIHGVSIGVRALVGLGTTVLRDVAPGKKHVGNPGRDL